MDTRVKPEYDEGVVLLQNKTARRKAGRSSLSCSLVTGPAQGPEPELAQGPARV